MANAVKIKLKSLQDRIISYINEEGFFTASGNISELMPSLNENSKPRVIHFVTGGFSGATQVAIDLVEGHLKNGHFQPLLVLRKKRQTNMQRVHALREKGVPVILVAGVSHQLTIKQLERICELFSPDIFVAHGFSEHIWGRIAAINSNVPHIIHVEHNSRERYTKNRLSLSVNLAEKTDAIVACSDGVKNSLLRLGFPEDKVTAINNGIRLEPFSAVNNYPWIQRQPGIVMAARFSRQKDHKTLIKAIAILRDEGIVLNLYLAGGGKKCQLKKMKSLVKKLFINEQVHFLGVYKDIPNLYMTQKVCVLSTHYEGLPLTLIEGMAAGCVAIASNVDGVKELIKDSENGFLFQASDANSLAQSIKNVLSDDVASSKISKNAIQDANKKYSLNNMLMNYENLFFEIMGEKS